MAKGKPKSNTAIIAAARAKSKAAAKSKTAQSPDETTDSDLHQKIKHLAAELDGIKSDEEARVRKMISSMHDEQRALLTQHGDNVFEKLTEQLNEHYHKVKQTGLDVQRLLASANQIKLSLGNDMIKADLFWKETNKWNKTAQEKDQAKRSEDLREMSSILRDVKAQAEETRASLQSMKDHTTYRERVDREIDDNQKQRDSGMESRIRAKMLDMLRAMEGRITEIEHKTESTIRQNSSLSRQPLDRRRIDDPNRDCSAWHVPRKRRGRSQSPRNLTVNCEDSRETNVRPERKIHLQPRPENTSSSTMLSRLDALESSMERLKLSFRKTASERGTSPELASLLVRHNIYASGRDIPPPYGRGIPLSSSSRCAMAGSARERELIAQDFIIATTHGTLENKVWHSQRIASSRARSKSTGVYESPFPE